jgi:hypothetical protein
MPWIGLGFMSKLKLLAVCMFFISGGVFAAERPSTVAPQLPPGSMRNKALTGCTVCHDSYIIVQQRLSKAAWGKEVDKMIKWGAIVNPSDRDPLVDYFSTNFSPDKPPYIAQRSASKAH